MNSLVITELNFLEEELADKGNVKGGLVVLESKVDTQGDVSRIFRGPLTVSSTTSFTENSSQGSSSDEDSTANPSQNSSQNSSSIPIPIPSTFSLPNFSYL